MARYEVGTTNAYTNLICNTSPSIQGSWPDLKFRIDYNFQIWTVGAWNYNGTQFTFHTTTHSRNVNIGAGTSGVLDSGFIELGWGDGRSVNHKPGFSMNMPGVLSGSGVADEYLSIPGGTLASNLVSVTHDSCVINVQYTSPYNYWYVAVYNGNKKLKDCAIGENTIDGLSPGKDYSLTVKLIGRDGKAIEGKNISFKTTGFSYLDNDVTIDIEDKLEFVLHSYSDTFTNDIVVSYGNTTICEYLGIKSIKLLYPISYTFTQEQINAIYASIPNALKVVGKIVVKTYENGNLLGSTEKSLTMNINPLKCAPTLSAFTYKDISKALDKTGDNQYIVQNVSKIQIPLITASAIKGASISSYRLAVGDNQVMSDKVPLTIDLPVTANSGMYVTVIDSRGLQTILFKPFNIFIEYQQPFISKFEAERVNGVEESTNVDVEGVFNRLTIDNIDKNTSLSMKVRYKPSDVSTWSEYVNHSLTLIGTKFTYDNIVAQLDTGKAYDIEVSISDYFYSVTAIDVVFKSEFEFFVGDGFAEASNLDVLHRLTVEGHPVLWFASEEEW